MSPSLSLTTLVWHTRSPVPGDWLGWAQPRRPPLRAGHCHSNAVQAPGAWVPRLSGQRAALAQAACGTWVLYQVSSCPSSEGAPPKIGAALSFRAWSASPSASPGTPSTSAATARTTRSSGSRTRSRRARAKPSPSDSWPGPSRVAACSGPARPTTGTDGHRVPLPFDNGTGRHAVFLRGRMTGTSGSWPHGRASTASGCSTCRSTARTGRS